MKSGKKEVIFDDEELIFNCGNFLISVKCSVLISFFFISDLFLISNFKEEADDKDGGDKEDEVIKINSGEIDNVNLTSGKSPGVG